jgi:cytochrome c oxidase assembly protein subunit 15
MYSLFVVFATTFMLYAGGFTTSIGAGMVFPDWPLSNGSLNPEGWLENQAMMAEHGHRLLGATIGFLTLSLAIWIWLRDSRKWMRLLAVTCLVAVILQGLLGGFRVLFNNLQFAMIHGCLAQIFLCMLVSIAAGLSAWWFRDLNFPSAEQGGNSKIRQLGLVVCGLIFVQLIVAAIMRHSGAGLAIPTFPLTPEGGLIPESWNFRVSIHFTHRAMALVIFTTYIYWASRILTTKGLDGRIKSICWVALILLFAQVTLGAMVIWSGRRPIPTTVHVLTGAFLFAFSWLITFFQYNRELKRSVSSGYEEAESVDFPEVSTGQSHP